MSDSYFIGTVARVHGLRRSVVLKAAVESTNNGVVQEEIESMKLMQKLGSLEDREDKELAMMVSLSHTIYFHHVENFRADEWIFAEMATPWAGEGRGLVTQKMLTQDGKLVATCVQEVPYVL